jgi:hypothetical protein
MGWFGRWAHGVSRRSYIDHVGVRIACAESRAPQVTLPARSGVPGRKTSVIAAQSNASESKENAMTKTLALTTAILLSSSLARAADESSATQLAPESADTPSDVPSASPVIAPAPVQAPAPVAPPELTMAGPNPRADSEAPQPYTGWSRGLRAPMYVHLMMAAGAFGEDGSNRLTTRDSKVLEGAGAIFRVGAVLGPNHRLGARIQSFFRPTKKILLDPNSGPATDSNQWGGVSFVYGGPEYIYDTGFGLYAGGSIGIAGAMSTRDLDHDDDKRDDIERGSAGAAGMLSVGYEWRVSKWFAMNAEAYGGLYHGIDDDEKTMNGSLFGLAMGVGF